MRKYIFYLCLIPILSFMSCSKNTHSMVNNETVKNVDLNRYMGLWYEIARFDYKWERDLVGVTAEYSLMSNGKVKVVNSGYEDTLNGKFKSSTGKAKLADKNTPGHLRVAFFLWFYADYFILDLDQENYSYALVGGKDGDYLWILSRTPQLPQQTIDMLVEKARSRGYDTSKLIWTPQKEG